MDYAPVIDVPDQLYAKQTRETIRRQMEMYRALGFTRVYVVLLPPDLFAPDARANVLAENTARLGDPYRVYLEEARAAGLEAWAVFKPYEAAGLLGTPFGAPAPASRASVRLAGGEMIFADPFTAEHPEYRLAARPEPPAAPPAALEVSFCLDAVTDVCGPDARRSYPARAAAPFPARLWASDDGGVFEPVDREPAWAQERRDFLDANGRVVLADAACLTLTFRELPDKRFFAVQSDAPMPPTLPYSMARLLDSEGAPVPSCGADRVRVPRDPAWLGRDPAAYVWGEKGLGEGDVPGEAPEAAEAFRRFGFAFESLGVCFWGDGWVTPRVLGVMRGRDATNRCSLCEGYPEVRAHWDDLLFRYLDCIDGADVRLQCHSAGAGDWMRYGFNEPILARYRELYGGEPGADADPYRLMRVRGGFFEEWYERAAARLHAAGKRLAFHIHSFYDEERPSLAYDFDAAGFWAQPHILCDWKRLVALADEVVCKDYHHGRLYGRSAGLKAFARGLGKPVWEHLYIQQGDACDEATLARLADGYVTGILLYEMELNGLYETEQSCPQDVIENYVRGDAIRAIAEGRLGAHIGKEQAHEA